MINPVAAALVRLSTNTVLLARNAIVITYATVIKTHDHLLATIPPYEGDLDECPSCGSLDLNAPSLYDHGDKIISDNSCAKCDSWWSDEFHITTRRVNLGHTVHP